MTSRCWRRSEGAVKRHQHAPGERQPQSRLAVFATSSAEVGDRFGGRMRRGRRSVMLKLVFKFILIQSDVFFNALPSSPLRSDSAKHLPRLCCRHRIICVKTRLENSNNPLGRGGGVGGEGRSGSQQRTPLQNSGFAILILHAALPLPLARL